MVNISQSITKKDHIEKMMGETQYIADYVIPGMNHAKIVRAWRPHARIKSVRFPEMETGYFVIDYRDVPKNGVKIIRSEQPVFAENEVRFIGEAVAMIVGADVIKVNAYVEQVKIEYEDLPAALSLDASDDAMVSYHYAHGAVTDAFQKAARVIEKTYYTGHQEQAYIEPQGAIGLYQDGKITVIASMQCPYYVKDAVTFAMDVPAESVQIIQSTTGGAFGGKEDYPSLIGCMVAAAAKKTGKPVRLIFERGEDMTVTTKRHPAQIVYSAALDEHDGILGIKADIKLDGGAYEGLSGVVLQRSMIAAAGVYRFPCIEVSGQVMMTHTVPNGAFRGFGAPQSFFAIERFMTHLATHLGIQDPVDFKKRYFVKQGDSTATGGSFRYPVILPEMLETAESLSRYTEKHERYRMQTGRYRKGIGMSFFLHGCGFTGSAEKDYIKSVIKLVKYPDDTIELLTSTTDMGQGVKTTFAKIVAEVMALPIDQIKIVNPDTDRVPNSGPTVASRSLMIVGKLLERAAKRLKSEYVAGKYQEVEERYVHPEMVPWDITSFSGDAYPTYSWGINVIEVEVDTLLAETKLIGVWGIFDVGRAIDETIMRGQIEGGMLQGIGYASSEKMEIIGGAVRQSGLSDYIIPTAKDTVPFVTRTLDNPYDGGPFGAKGAGELTIIGSAPAYAEAVEQAAGVPVAIIPMTPERLLAAMKQQKRGER